MKVYKTHTGRSCMALKRVKYLIRKFDLQPTHANNSTDIADYFLKEGGGSRSYLFVMAVSPFLFDTSNDHIVGVFRFSEVYPPSQTNLKDYLHLLQAFLTATAQTSRTPKLSTQRWIASALLYSLKTKDDTLAIMHENSFYARHPLSTQS